ncbi:hypothetical protein WJT86_09330 [Microvirga sp. W0021]|uniref:Uncharacterized protein n=2 Tax=Hohaiivirga grylli TaxID=3133970 RepID=A0ABV0BJT8_9HYPH
MSVSLDGNNIQLSFQKDNQSTAVVLDAEAARSLVRALGQLLNVLDDQDDDETEELSGLEQIEENVEGEVIDTSDMIDITSPTIDIGLDSEGHAILTFQAGVYAPMLIRLRDEEARYIANGLLEILNSPQDIRTSGGGH